MNKRDLEDLKKIILKNKEFDLDYILNWLKFFEDITEQKLIEKFLNIKNNIFLGLLTCIYTQFYRHRYNYLLLIL